MSAVGKKPSEAAGQVSGSRISPAHGRSWVETGMTGLPHDHSYPVARDAGLEAQLRAKILRGK